MKLYYQNDFDIEEQRRKSARKLLWMNPTLDFASLINYHGQNPLQQGLKRMGIVLAFMVLCRFKNE